MQHTDYSLITQHLNISQSELMRIWRYTRSQSSRFATGKILSDDHYVFERMIHKAIAQALESPRAFSVDLVKSYFKELYVDEIKNAYKKHEAHCGEMVKKLINELNIGDTTHG